MKAIQISNLEKIFTGKKNVKVPALKGISLDIDQGEVFGFLGPNGAGKSTTIKCLMGLIRPTGGAAAIMGEPVGSVLSRYKVGFLPENPAFFEYLSAKEYLHFVGSTFGMSSGLIESRSEESLKLLELWDARNRPMRGYSKGMVQRVGLAQTLIHDPDVFILDEPMSGLDPIGRALVKDVIVDLKKRGKCVFFSTHITDDIEKVCDRVAVINKGQLLAVDNVANILERGVEGYNVQLSSPDSPIIKKLVDKADLQKFIERSVADGCAIELIEPKRKNMEAFFLEIVSSEPPLA